MERKQVIGLILRSPESTIYLMKSFVVWIVKMVCYMNINFVRGEIRGIFAGYVRRKKEHTTAVDGRSGTVFRYDR